MTWKNPNPGGRPKTKKIRDAFLNCVSNSELDIMARAVLEKAKNAEEWACEFVRDTLDGKPKQEIEINDERSAGLADRFAQLLSEGNKRVDPGRESGTSRVN